VHILVALIVGLVFGLGLIVGGMTNPAKVQGFLDLAGNWDPSLALVMGGAISVALFAFQFAGKRERALLGDARLVLGGLTFGAGWGLAGFCPGPALASLATGGIKPLIFTVAMLAGMGVFEVLEHLAARGRPRST
jgi:uncharacterized protein